MTCEWQQLQGETTVNLALGNKHCYYSKFNEIIMSVFPIGRLGEFATFRIGRNPTIYIYMHCHWIILKMIEIQCQIVKWERLAKLEW